MHHGDHSGHDHGPADDHRHDGHHHHHHGLHHHGHHHRGDHHHGPASYGAAFAIGTVLNLGFVAAEVVYGFVANSVSLLADAGHNLGDVIGLLLAWAAAVLVKRAPSARFTYGLRSTSIFAALINAVVLLIAVGAIALEAVQRLAHPEPVAAWTVMIVAGAGILVNGCTALLFVRGAGDDINLRAAFLHMASDAAISLGVVVSGAMMLATGWPWLDPVVSILVSAVIVWGTWGLLTESMQMALQAVPRGIDPGRVRGWLEAQPGVVKLHDLHIWAMSTTETALTCHLVMPGGHPGDGALAEICRGLAREFRIAHATLQIETGDGDACALEPDHVV